MSNSSANSETASSQREFELAGSQEEPQKERLNSLLKWYSQVLERIDEVGNRLVQGEITEERAAAYIKGVTTVYVEDALKTLRGNGFGDYIWPTENGRELGAVVVEAPTPYDVAWRQARPPDRIGPDPPENPDQMPPRYSLVNESALEDKTFPIVGLNSFVNAGKRVSETYTVELSGPDGRQTHSMTASTVMPRHISKTAFDWTNGLLSQLGVGIGVQEAQKEAVGEYSLLQDATISDKFKG